MKYTAIEQAVIELDGEWPEPKRWYRGKFPEGWLYVTIGDGNLRRQTAYPGASDHICTYSEFMGARARLENKPTKWPYEANYLAQDSDGTWEFYKAKPREGDLVWGPRDIVALEPPPVGHVFGDWRESLEHRPEPTSKPQWVPGETLPPVGAFVDVTGDVQYGSGETNCEVVAHVETCAVIRMSYGLGCFESYVLSPTKTERERVIQAAMKAGMRDGGYHLPVDFCEALYDAGMLVMPEGEK